jgi:ABC-type lipoprotein release transport system permease subunit
MMWPLVFGVGTREPVSFGVVPLVLLGVAAGATLIPAVRASRVSPVEIIRVD